jgi:peptidoglycan/LPS O-acetylase OafA/YrhL
MTSAMSLYLDLGRLTAAFVVLLSHFAYSRISGGEYLEFRRFGSDAVVLFFVLSGYVIAYVTAEREHTLRDYALSRLARLYSVVLPALIITIVLDQLGQRIDPRLYDGWWYADDQPFKRFFANLFFVNQLWFESIRPFSNGPFWSLGYEFWYYVLFGLAYYLKGRRRFLCVALVCLVIGPKILLLLPVWLAGYWTYHCTHRIKISYPLAAVLFIAPIAAYAMIKFNRWDTEVLEWTIAVLGSDTVRHLIRESDEFVISYVYAVLIVVNFIGAHALGPHLYRVLGVIEKPIRYCASFTFSMYLLHYPLLQLFGAVFQSSQGDAWRNALLLGSTLGSVVVLGHCSEHQKKVYHRAFSALVPRRWSSVKADLKIEHAP